MSFFSAKRALLNIRSTQHNNKWKEFTKSSEIAGKFPEIIKKNRKHITNSENQL